ncbi:hypothetical protein EYF80_003757 [Liparis tanakae]|uniref:Uncharacterized protein n=1 Tax=Liparis tanakae TaxID=230148 RepID=A0A4Z2J8D1_9TELE|nr:hypothetical protein EYF80_003757 [Liparis tanakae]
MDSPPTAVSTIRKTMSTVSHSFPTKVEWLWISSSSRVRKLQLMVSLDIDPNQENQQVAGLNPLDSRPTLAQAVELNPNTSVPQDTRHRVLVSLNPRPLISVPSSHFASFTLSSNIKQP